MQIETSLFAINLPDQGKLYAIVGIQTDLHLEAVGAHSNGKRSEFRAKFTPNRWPNRSTHLVAAIYLSMERPNAATLELLLTRVVLPKAPWLVVIGSDMGEPMYGIP